MVAFQQEPEGPHLHAKIEAAAADEKAETKSQATETGGDKRLPRYVGKASSLLLPLPEPKVDMFKIASLTQREF